MPDRLCPHCGTELHQERTSARVFGMLRITQTTIVEYHCSRCTHRQRVDGSEVFMLRKQHFKSQVLGEFELCFTWEALYDAVTKLSSGTYFYRIFCDLLAAYRRAGETLSNLCAMQSIYRLLKEAIMDFIDLMNLPFHTMTCTCGGSYYIADGVACGTKKDAQYCTGGWLPAPVDELVPAQFGSGYAGRFVLRQKDLRVALRVMARTGGGTAYQLTELQRLCDQYQNASLQLLFGCEDAVPPELHGAAGVGVHGGGAAPRGRDAAAPDAVALEAMHELPDDEAAVPVSSFLKEGPDDMWEVPEWAQDFFRLISSESPALAMVQPVDIPVLRRWQQLVDEAMTVDDPMSVAWPKEDKKHAIRSMPLMYQYMRTILSDAKTRRNPEHCKALSDLVTAAIEVRLVLLWFGTTVAYLIQPRTAELVSAFLGLFNTNTHTMPHFLPEMPMSAELNAEIVGCSRPLDVEVTLASHLQASIRCCTPEKPPQVIRTFQPLQKLKKTKRKQVNTTYRSRQEAYFNNALYASTVSDEQACNNKGHCHIPLFAADQKTSDKRTDDCTKLKYSAGALAPGIMV